MKKCDMLGCKRGEGKNMYMLGPGTTIYVCDFCLAALKEEEEKNETLG